MKLASALVFGLVATLFAGWWLFVRAPAPAEVCEHVLEVTLREAQSQGLSPESQGSLVEKLRSGCIEHKLDKIQLRGRIAYASYARCIMSQETRVDIDRCK